VQTPDDWSNTLPLRDITPSLNESGSGSLPLKKKKSDENRKLGEAGYQEIFSVPGPIYRQGISDRCLIYNVNDKPEYLSGTITFEIYMLSEIIREDIAVYFLFQIQGSYTKHILKNNNKKKLFTSF
jgi:hypothetical protein